MVDRCVVILFVMIASTHFFEALVRVALMDFWVGSEPFLGLDAVKLRILDGTVLPQFRSFCHVAVISTVVVMILSPATIVTTVLLRVPVRICLMDVLSLIVMILMARAGSLLVHVRQVVKTSHPVGDLIRVHVDGIRARSGIQ